VVRLRGLSVDRVAAWSQANEHALAPTTARIALITLGQVCRFAVRRGWLAENPVSKLEPAEKPRWTPVRAAILEPEQLAALLEHAGNYRLLFEFLAHTGLRIGEALALTWADIDHDNGLIRVHRQLSRQREHASLKTEAGRREVVLAAPLARRLREHRLASRYKQSSDFVFANTLGRGLDYRDVGEGFRQARQARGPASAREAHAPLAPPRLRLAPDRQRPERRLRLAPTRPRQPEHHPGGLRAPVRAGRPRRGGQSRARRKPRDDEAVERGSVNPEARPAPPLLW
jgi:integrase